MAQTGEPADARKMVERAMELVETKGPDTAFRIMNSQPQEFVDGALYIFVVDQNENIVAHAGDPARVGSLATETIDSDGQNIGELLRAAANEYGAWVDYRFMNIASGKIEPKTTWVVLEGDYMYGAGVYKAP